MFSHFAYEFLLNAAYFVAFLLTLIAIFAGYIVWVRSKYSHIPGPPVKAAYFFFGNIHELNFDRVDNYQVFMKWHQQYGEIWKLFLFHTVVVFASSPGMAKELLTKSKYNKAGRLYTKFKTVLGVPFMGNGLVTNLDQADWKLKRHALNPAFHRSFLYKLISVFNKASDNLLKDLSKVAQSGETVSILNELQQATLDVIGEVAFSYDIRDNDKDLTFASNLYQCFKSQTETSLDITLKYNPLKRKYRHDVRQAATYIRKYVENILDKRISDFQSGAEIPKDILTIMLQNMSELCSKEEIIDEMLTLFIAGQETTANTLSFCLMELGRHPKYLERVRDEVESLIGDKDFITNEDLDKLDWVTAAIKETLRLYPPSGGTAREMPQSEKLGNFIIPKGTNILINFFVVQRLYHENGSDFKPEWWLQENSPQTEFNYMPFSLGQRSCIGKQFAYTEAKLILCKILQKFDYKLDPTQKFGVEDASTQRPVDGVRLTLYSRNK